jgi:hypothetical protein
MDRTQALLILAVGAVGLSGAAWFVTRGGGAPGSPGSCPAGQLAIQLIAQGPGTISAGMGDDTRGTITICPAVGDTVQYSALPDPGHAFLRFEGPGGVTTSDNPFTAPSEAAGFVRAVFS